MIKTTVSRMIALALLVSSWSSLPQGAARAEERPGLVQIGGMHEAIGKGQHQGRVALAEIVAGPHFYGVGALEGLNGEITILDSEAIVTSVTGEGEVHPLEDAAEMATLLVGQSVEAWMEVKLAGPVRSEQFDETIGRAADGMGFDLATPFVFVVDGEFEDVRLHVINGACPVHARMKNLELGEEERPFELEAATMKGTLVGVYAEGSVGGLTHPATTTHAHLIYADEKTGERVTGHLEQVGLGKGTMLRLPDSGPEDAAEDGGDQGH